MLIQEIMDKQAYLVSKFHGVEGSPLSLDIHKKSHQMLVRDYAWRITEEMGEWLLEYDKFKDTPSLSPQFMNEEMIDVLSFTIGLAHLLGVDVSDIRLTTNPIQGEAYAQVGQLTKELSAAVNLLKAKAWRKSYPPTDLERFNKAYHNFVASVMAWIGKWLFPGQISEQYELKYQKNLGRIQNGY